MKGRLNSTIAVLVLLMLAGTIAALLLGFSAGEHSGGVSVLDLTGLPAIAGMRLLAGLGVALAGGDGGVVYGQQQDCRAGSRNSPCSPRRLPRATSSSASK